MSPSQSAGGMFWVWWELSKVDCASVISAGTTISLQQTNVRELILETKVGFVGFVVFVGSCGGFLGTLTPLFLSVS